MGESFPDTKSVPSSQRCEPGSVNLPVCKWPASAKADAIDADAIATPIIDSINAALAKKDYRAIADLFTEDGYWRDHLALSWDLRTVQGPDKIAALLAGEPGSRLKTGGIESVTIDRSSAFRAPRVVDFTSANDPARAVRGITLFTSLTLADGAGRGVTRFAEQSDGSWKIWTFYSCRESIKGHEEPVGLRRPIGVQHGDIIGRKNWLDRRKEGTAFENSDPDVLIIGAGQGGLTAHARLKMLNVPTLIIDANDTVGDNWRKRYHQLVLHDPVWYDHMPYLRFPEYWPVFTPKDKLAEWFETYATTLELNIWMRSSPEPGAVWDDATKRWTITIRRVPPGGGEPELRVLHPKHIVQATGHSGKMYFPDIPGRDTFQGDLLVHSSQFPGARDLKPDAAGNPPPKKKAVIVGACNSSHDICQDYYEKGYDVTMIQRSSTCVVSSDAATEILLGETFCEDGPPVEDGDVWQWGWPSAVIKAIHINVTRRQVAYDAKLLDELERAGFKLDRGPDDAGLFIKYMQRGGGYYFDVGASRLITTGAIRVKQGVEVAEIVPQGLRMADGEVLEADEIIFATGYENMRTQARLILGDALADRVNDIWGWDAEGEIRALWRPSGHPGFWFQGGNLAMCRHFSRFLALQIKARLLGLAE